MAEISNEKYVLKLDGDYYAGPNQKYADMFNISGLGALGAKRLTKEDAEKLCKHFKKNNWDAEVEEYNAKNYIKESLEKIIEYENRRKNGYDCGYAIENLAKHCLKYLEQI